MHFRTLVTLSAGLLVVSISGSPARASSHAEAPMIAEDPKADNTDVYFFRSPEDPTKVVVLANYIPLEQPSAGPTYYYFSDEVLYAIHFDRNQDGRVDTEFRFRFRTRVQTPGTFLSYLGPITQLTRNGGSPTTANGVNPLYNRFQTYTITLVDRTTNSNGRVIAQDVLVPPNNAGPTTTSDFRSLTSQAVYTIPGTGIRTFAGQVDDPFFIDLGAFFDLLRVRPFRSLHALQGVDPRPNRTDAPDMLSGYNVHTIALELPITFLSGTATVPGPNDASRILGVYASASRPRIKVIIPSGEASGGPFVQVSRLGNPLVNELFNPLVDPDNLRRTRDDFNRTPPSLDARFRKSYQFPEAALRLAQLYPALRGVVPNVTVDAQGTPSFTGPRTDLLGGVTPLLNFVPDYLRLDVSVPITSSPNRLGVIGGDAQGYPNGRRLGDDVVDIFMRVAAGALFPDTITVNGQSTTRGAFLNSINFGDGVNTHENGRFGFLGTFPFVGTAHPGVLPANVGYDDPEKQPASP